MEMEMGWRVEKRVGRGSQEQLSRGFNKGGRVGEKLKRGERGDQWKKERINKMVDRIFLAYEELQ